MISNPSIQEQGLPFHLIKPLLCPPVADSVCSLWTLEWCPRGFVPGPIHSAANVSGTLSCSVFCDQMLFVFKKALQVGVFFVLQPPGLLLCEMPADTEALCAPQGQKERASRTCVLGSTSPSGWPAPTGFAQMEPVQGAPQAIRQGGPTHAAGARKGLNRHTKASSGQPVERNEAGKGGQPPRSPSPVIRAHRSLWPQLNKPGCN